MMKKNIACPNCKGNGYITIVTGNRNDQCGVASKVCTTCEGTGVLLVDMTNADRIRAMSDKELAELIVKHKPSSSWCKGVREIWMQPNVTKIEAWVKWLQQPAEEK